MVLELEVELEAPLAEPEEADAAEVVPEVDALLEVARPELLVAPELDVEAEAVDELAVEVVAPMVPLLDALPLVAEVEAPALEEVPPVLVATPALVVTAGRPPSGS